ncbi:hypothetical protein D9M71_646600 [compost metagenome]
MSDESALGRAPHRILEHLRQQGATLDAFGFIDPKIAWAKRPRGERVAVASGIPEKIIVQRRPENRVASGFLLLVDSH